MWPLILENMEKHYFSFASTWETWKNSVFLVSTANFLVHCRNFSSFVFNWCTSLIFSFFYIAFFLPSLFLCLMFVVLSFVSTNSDRFYRFNEGLDFYCFYFSSSAFKNFMGPLFETSITFLCTLGIKSKQLLY